MTLFETVVREGPEPAALMELASQETRLTDFGDPRLGPGRRDQPVGPATMLGAVADGEHVRIGDTSHLVVHDHTRADR